MILGPSINVHRVALNGRNAEYVCSVCVCVCVANLLCCLLAYSRVDLNGIAPYPPSALTLTKERERERRRIIIRQHGQPCDKYRYVFLTDFLVLSIANPVIQKKQHTY